MDLPEDTEEAPAADCAAAKSKRHRKTRERGNGRGSVYLTSGRALPWRATITRGWDVWGKVIRTSRFFATEEEALAGIEEMIRCRDLGKAMPKRAGEKVLRNRKRPVWIGSRVRETRPSLRLRFDVFHRDDFACVYCGRRPPEVALQIDHVQPISRSGGAEIDNLVTACRECNLGKSGRYVAD